MEKRFDRRDDIIRVAARMFYQNGFDATTMRELAREIGVRQGTLYHYYESKSDLLYSILNNSYQHAREAVDFAIESTMNSREQMSAALAAHMRYFLDCREESGLQTEARHLTPLQQTEIRAKHLIYVERFRQLLARGIREGVFRPCDVKFTILLMVSAATPIAQWYRHDGQLTADEVVAAYTDYCIRGVLQPTQSTQKTSAPSVDDSGQLASISIRS